MTSAKQAIVSALQLLAVLSFFYVVLACLAWGIKHPKAQYKQYIANWVQVITFNKVR